MLTGETHRSACLGLAWLLRQHSCCSFKATVPLPLSRDFWTVLVGKGNQILNPWSHSMYSVCYYLSWRDKVKMKSRTAWMIDKWTFSNIHMQSIEKQSKSWTVFNIRIASDSDTWAYSTAEISPETKWWHCWNSPWWWCLCTKNRHFQLGLMIREKPHKFRCFQ